MNLKLLSTDKASVYSLPVRSQSEEDAVASLLTAGWDERSAREHVAAAVAAGAYARTRAALHPETKSKE